MKKFFINLTLLLLVTVAGYAQKQVKGVVADTTGVTIPGVVVKLTSPQDTLGGTTDINGVFTFGAVKAKQFSITFQSIGYQGLKRTYNVAEDAPSLNIGTIKLKTESKMLTTVNITDVNAVKIKEDTTVYDAKAYPVRANASTEEVLKKLPGVDVDANGNVTAEGKQVTKVRINGKDFFGGDVQTATKNLPADVIESIQMIDDYGDQANLTGIKSGEPNKVMNIVIRKDRNYGYSISGTAGGGRDMLPAPQADATRYTFSTNSFKFKGDQQIALLGSLNNNNTNTFNFGGGGFGGGGFGGGGGGGRGNASRGGGGGAGGGSTTASTQNGITDAKSVGLNFRDQWGKTLSVYGSYSFADNSTNTISTSQQNNIVNKSINNQNSNETDGVLNHRVTWNMEWKPDTVNYLKFTPTYSYGNTTTLAYDANNFQAVPPNGTDYAVYQNYFTNTTANSNTHSIGAILLYNHRFNGHGRNFSVQANGSSAPNVSFQNPINTYLVGRPNAPQNQLVSVNSRTNSYNATFSYIEPLSKVSFLEGSYTYSHAHTTNDKTVDTLAYSSVNNPVVPPTEGFYDRLSNNYAFDFITNRFALNYRFIKEKYNFTLGLGVQPAELKGSSPATATQAAVNTDVTTTNFSPTVRYVYNFSRSQAFTFNYNGNNNQPSYNQLNPRLDLSNASYPVQGNALLKPEFSNNFSLRYNQFSFGTGNILFTNISFTQVTDHIIQNTISYPHKYKPDQRLNNAIETTYSNENGYYTGSGFFTFAKPWSARKFTLILNGNVSYANNISYGTVITANADSLTYSSVTTKNIAKTLTFTPALRFRVDIQDVIDAQASAAYAMTDVNNSVASSINPNYQTTILGLNGKNYFWTNWTLSYDYTKTIYSGYTGVGALKNPNIFTTYVERRFLKNNAATIRAAVYDVFNENTGYTNTATASQQTTTNVNRLGRYFLLTFTLRLQKFAGKAPQMDMGPDGGGRRRREGGDGGGHGPGGGGMGGPGGGFGGPGGM